MANLQVLFFSWILTVSFSLGGVGAFGGSDFLPFTALRVFIFLDFLPIPRSAFTKRKKDKVKNRNVQ